LTHPTQLVVSERDHMLEPGSELAAILVAERKF
jgi:hypothetical protein